jgi:hypothetical protein
MCSASSGFGLVGRNGAKCYKHGRIHDNTVVQWSADDLLDGGDFGCWKVCGSGVSVGCILDGCTIGGFDPVVWSILWGG